MYPTLTFFWGIYRTQLEQPIYTILFSGQQVLGPRRDDTDMVTKIFDAARRAGAEQLSPEEAAAGSSRGTDARRAAAGVGGGGYRLGGHGIPTERIEDSDSDVEVIAQQPVSEIFWSCKKLVVHFFEFVF